MVKWKASAFVLIAAALWGVIGLFFDRLSSFGLTSVEVVFCRVAVALACMGIWICIKDRGCFKIRLKDIWMFIGTGIISLAFFNICYFNAISIMELSIAATLLYTAPVFVMILSLIVFKESLTLQKGIAVVVTFLGCILVTGVLNGGSFQWQGILFGLGSGIGYALYSIFSKIALKRYNSETITFYTFLFAVLGIAPLCRWNEMGELFKNESSQMIVYSLGIGIVSCLLPYLFYTKGLEGVRPSEASIMATLEPVVAAVIGVMFLDESITVGKFMGILCILGAIVLLNIPMKNKKDKAE